MRRGRRLVADFAPDDYVEDVAPFAAPVNAWTSMLNMKASGAGMERASGEVLFCNPLSIVPKFAMSAYFANEVWMLYAGAAGVYVTNGVSHYNVTPTTGWADFTAGMMNGGLCNGYPVFATESRPPWYWDGGLVVGSVKPLPGFLAGTQARVLFPFNAHVFAGSLSAATTQLERLAWSDAAAVGTVPATWVPTATNQAGELLLSTGAGPINGMRGLGSSLMVYRTTGAWQINYVGRPYIYTARKVAADVGCATVNGIAEVRGAHVVLSPGDLVLCDGTTVRSIGEGRVKRSIFAGLTDAGLKVSHVYATPGSGEVVFAFALGNDTRCKIGYIWNYERDKWSIRELPEIVHGFSTFVPSLTLPSTWDTDAGEWSTDYRQWNAGPQGGFAPRAVGVSNSRSAAYLVDEGDNSYRGGPVESLVERTGLAVGAPDRVKLFTRIHPRIDGTPGAVVDVQVGSQVGMADPVSWGATRPYIIGTSRHVDALQMGRYLAVRFGSSAGSRWSISGFTVEYEERGRQ